MVNVGEVVRVKYARRVSSARVVELLRSGAIRVEFLPDSPHAGQVVAVSVMTLRR